jgi:hypothetical protein
MENYTQAEYDALKARVEQLEREKANEGSALKVTDKGSVSMYTLGRFPVTLTKKQWHKVIAFVESKQLANFLAANDSKLFQGHAAEKKS